MSSKCPNRALHVELQQAGVGEFQSFHGLTPGHTRTRTPGSISSELDHSSAMMWNGKPTVSDRVEEDGLVRSSLARACLAVRSIRCLPLVVDGGGDGTWRKRQKVSALKGRRCRLQRTAQSPTPDTPDSTAKAGQSKHTARSLASEHSKPQLGSQTLDQRTATKHCGGVGGVGIKRIWPPPACYVQPHAISTSPKASRPLKRDGGSLRISLLGGVELDHWDERMVGMGAIKGGLE